MSWAVAFVEANSVTGSPVARAITNTTIEITRMVRIDWMTRLSMKRPTYQDSPRALRRRMGCHSFRAIIYPGRASRVSPTRADSKPDADGHAWGQSYMMGADRMSAEAAIGRLNACLE